MDRPMTSITLFAWFRRRRNSIKSNMAIFSELHILNALCIIHAFSDIFDLE